jgi:hypothetical protein
LIQELVMVEVTAGHKLRLRFADGVEGELDVSKLVPFEGVFTSLRDPAEFRKVRLDPELGTVVWPSGADLDPIVLYHLVIAGRTEHSS